MTQEQLTLFGERRTIEFSPDISPLLSPQITPPPSPVASPRRSVRRGRPHRLLDDFVISPTFSRVSDLEPTRGRGRRRGRGRGGRRGWGSRDGGRLSVNFMDEEEEEEDIRL